MSESSSFSPDDAPREEATQSRPAEAVEDGLDVNHEALDTVAAALDALDADDLEQAEELAESLVDGDADLGSAAGAEAGSEPA